MNNTVLYIYNISFGIAAIIAFLSITYAGFLYLTSAGNPAKIKEARDRILSSLLGIGILLVSYILLITINPGLTLLTAPTLGEVNLTKLQPLPPKEAKSSYLSTIKEIGVMGKLTIEGIEETGDTISESLYNFQDCLCAYAESLCLCTGGEEGSKCEPQTCYGSPCRNKEEIERDQELIMLYLDELIYYQNRAVGSEFINDLSLNYENVDIVDIFNNWSFDLAIADLANLEGEARRLQQDISRIINPTIKYYDDFIATQTDQTIIETLSAERAKKQEELKLTEDLRNELMFFAFFVDALKYPVENIAKFPGQCALTVQKECKPFCLYLDIQIGKHKMSACHNTYLGCESRCGDPRQGDVHPCPDLLADILVAAAEFEFFQGEITNKTENITEIVDKIRDIRTQI